MEKETRFKLRTLEWIFIFIFIGLIILSFYFSYNPEKAEILQVNTYQSQITSIETGLWIAFIVCTIGNLLPIPTPYTLIVWLVATSSYFQTHSLLPLLVGFISSLGALIGEIVGYFVGRGASVVLNSEEYRQIQFFHRLMKNHPVWAPFLIFLFGLTPLNDDMLMIPLGLIKYPTKRTIFFCWLGKLVMMIIFAYLPFQVGDEEVPYSFASTMLPLFLIVAFVYLFVAIDWLGVIQKSPKLQKMLKITYDDLNNDPKMSIEPISTEEDGD